MLRLSSPTLAWRARWTDLTCTALWWAPQGACVRACHGDPDCPVVSPRASHASSYVAPEVLTSRTYGPACDVWAVGVMLYILLVGYPPFYAETNREMFEQIKAGAYAFHPDAWCDVSDAAKSLVRSMLTVNVADRVTVAGALAHPFITTHQSDAPLVKTVAALKRFNAKRKFRVSALCRGWRMLWTLA